MEQKKEAGISRQAVPRLNQVIFPHSSVKDRLKVYRKTITKPKHLVSLIIFLIPGIAILPIKTLYNLAKKSWDYASDFFAILTNIR